MLTNQDKRKISAERGKRNLLVIIFNGYFLPPLKTGLNQAEPSEFPQHAACPCKHIFQSHCHPNLIHENPALTHIKNKVNLGKQNEQCLVNYHSIILTADGLEYMVMQKLSGCAFYFDTIKKCLPVTHIKFFCNENFPF